MVNEHDNPYDPPGASPKTAPPSMTGPRDINWMRAIFCIHVLATIASAFVVRSGTILSNQLIEVLIAIPLLLTIIVFPISMLIAAIVSLRKTLFVRGLAVVGDVALSAIQLFFWLPTWQ